MCDNGWDAADAQVVCRQLGHPFAEAHILTDVPHGIGFILYDQVSCDGTETSFSHCSKILNPDCSHDMDAGVNCGKL